MNNEKEEEKRFILYLVKGEVRKIEFMNQDDLDLLREELSDIFG